MATIKMMYRGEALYFKNGEWMDSKTKQLIEEMEKLVNSPTFEEKLRTFYKKIAIPTSIGVGLINIPKSVFAATAQQNAMSEQMKPLIDLVQNFALPVGILISSWGLLEIIMGNFAAGKEKIKYALIGFVGMYVIPEVFYTIQRAFA